VTPVAPALSPDGQRLALPLMVERVIHEDSRGRTGETVSVKVDVHHVTTGQHETLEICGDQCVLSVLRWSPDGRSLAVLAYDERGPVLMTRSMLDGGAELKETRLEDVALQVALAGWTDDSTVVVVPLTDSLSLGVDGWVTPVEIDARSGEVSRLPRLLVAENALDETLEPDSVTVVDGSLAVGTAWDGGPQWWVSELGEGQGFVDSFTAPTLDGPGGTGGTARLLHGLPRGDGAVITRAATGGPAYVITDRVDHDPALLTVMAPALDVQDIVLAADAPGGPVTTHPLGTRTSWWSWHPEMAAGLALTPFALIGTWFVVRRLRSRRG
jgi:hypothetical protein